MKRMSSERLTEILSEKLPKKRAERIEAIEYLTRVATGGSDEALRDGIFSRDEGLEVFVADERKICEFSSLTALPIQIEFERSSLILYSAIDAVLIPTLLLSKVNVHGNCACSADKIWLKFGTEKALTFSPPRAVIALGRGEKTSEVIDIQTLFLASASLRRDLFSVSPPR